MSINYYDKNIYSLFHPASLYIIENVKKLQCQRTTDEIYAQGKIIVNLFSENAGKVSFVASLSSINFY
jgi:hypothetical protein